jgi:hypothetical protein
VVKDHHGISPGGLVLSRLVQHVAWRGVELPEDALTLIDRVRGAAVERCRSREAKSAKLRNPVRPDKPPRLSSRLPAHEARMICFAKPS